MEDLLAQVNLLVNINCKLCVNSAVAIITAALNLTNMILQRLPYILFRSYPTYGYITDNRNYGYDTASHSCLKVGELLLSKTGSVFYSKLKDIPQNINDVLCQLYKLYPEVPASIIQKDALEFYKDLHSRGFIYLGEENDYSNTIQQYFSYNNVHSFELKISQHQYAQTTYEETFGQICYLTRVHVDISSRCNENCVHCYIPSRYKCGTMSEDLFDDILQQCRTMNVLNLTISGGEPMLNPFLKDFLLKCSQSNFSVNLLSNLTLLSDGLLDVISSSPLICVQTSLYAMDEGIHDSITRNQGSFRKTMDGIKRLHERNVPLQINCPIMKQNKNSYRSVLHFAKSLNIEADADYSLFGSFDNSRSNLSCRLSFGEIKDIVKETYLDKSSIGAKASKKTNSNDPICSVCKHSLCISNTGYIYPCEGWQSLKIGDLKEHTLKEIWEEGALVLHLRNLKYKNFPKCNACLYKKYCSICLIMNANEDPNGNYRNTNTLMCEISKVKANGQKTNRQCE